MIKLLWLSYSGFSHPDNSIALHGPVAVLTNLKKSFSDLDGKVVNLNNPFLYGYPEAPHVPSQAELHKKVEEILVKEKPDILFATGWMNEYPSLLGIITHVKKVSNNLLTVIGCPQPTWFPEKTLSICDEIDLLIKGEGDFATEQIIKYAKQEIQRKDIVNAYWKENGIISKSKLQNHQVQDVDALLLPGYGNFSDVREHWPIFSIDYNRGCSFTCIMCAHHEMSGYEVRSRSAEKVVDHIEQVIKDFGVRHFRISGSELGNNDAYSFSIEVIKRGLDIAWTCFGRVNNLTSKTLGLMGEAGCNTIFYGFESGDDGILTKLRKEFTVSEIKTQAKLTKAAGINVMGSVMVGNPGETKETVNKTKNLLFELANEGLLDYSPMLSFHIVPCSPIGENQSLQNQHGYKVNPDWKEMFFSRKLLHLQNPDKWQKMPLYKTNQGFILDDFSQMAGELSRELRGKYAITQASDDVVLISLVLGEDIGTVVDRYACNSDPDKPGTSLLQLSNDINKSWTRNQCGRLG